MDLIGLPNLETLCACMFVLLPNTRSLTIGQSNGSVLDILWCILDWVTGQFAQGQFAREQFTQKLDFFFKY